MFVITSIFDRNVQDLISNPILNTWPDNLEDYSDEQLIERISRSSNLEEVRNFVLAEMPDSNPQKQILIDDIDCALDELGIVFSPFPNFIEVPDDYFNQLNEFAKETALKIPLALVTEALKDKRANERVPISDFDDLTFCHKSLIAIDRELKELADDPSFSLRERNNHATKLTSFKNIYEELITSFISNGPPPAEGQHVKPMTSPTKPKSRPAYREEKLLEFLASRGFHSGRPNQSGTGVNGLRREAWEYVEGDRHFTRSTFEQSWKNLPKLD